MTTVGTATISGPFMVRPDLHAGKAQAWIEAATEGGRFIFPGGAGGGRVPVRIAGDGTATVSLARTDGIGPDGALWRLVVEQTGHQTYRSSPFAFTGDLTWDDVVETSDAPLSPSLVGAAAGYASAAAASAAAAAASAALAADISGISTTDTAVDTLVTSPSATRTSLDSRYLQVGLTGVQLASYNPDPTGATSSDAALTALLADFPTGGYRAYCKYGTYLFDSTRTFSHPGELVAERGTVFKKGTTGVTGSFWTIASADVGFDRIDFEDPGSHISGAGIFLAVNASSDRFALTRSRMNVPAGVAVRVNHIDRLNIDDLEIIACTTGLRISGAHTDGYINNVKISNWIERAFYSLGDTSGYIDGLTFRSCKARSQAAGGTTRYPFTVQPVSGTTNLWHRNITFDDCHVYGIGKSYNDGITPGNADCFGLYYIDGLEVGACSAEDGGDVGMTIANNMNFRVEDFRAMRNDTGGIAITNGTHGGSIVGGVLKNNGQNRNSDRSDDARSGLWVTGIAASVANLSMVGAVLGDDQSTKTQQYGASFTDVDNVKLAAIVDAANHLGLTHKATGATNIYLDGTAL